MVALKCVSARPANVALCGATGGRGLVFESGKYRVNWLFDIPPEVRIGAVFVLGVLIGTQVNRGIYRLAWHPRNIGPWSPRDEKAPPRQWIDYLPIVGWYALRREAKLHGAGYWLRPATIELMLGVGLALLYWWEVEQGLVPEAVWKVKKLPLPETWIHAQFAIHVILISLMTIASFIDIDEKYIPDHITVLGALLGLALAAALPMSRLPEWNAFIVDRPPATAWGDNTLLFVASPNPPPAWFNGPRGLAMGLGCYIAWWLAIVPAVWTTRYGLVKAIRYKLAGIGRILIPRPSRPREIWNPFLPMLVVGSIAIAVVWAQRDNIGLWRWQSLQSALVGMAAGGAIVWGVRIIGTHALGKEAMGFGDVTLVAMIGAFLGWQPCLMLFFIAPFIGVVIATLNLLISREVEIWYGPFLCAAAVIVIVFWATLWEQYGRGIFGMGLLVPALVVIIFAMMWSMLIIWRFIKEKIIFRERGERPHGERGA